jgi:hypothetical protein
VLRLDQVAVVVGPAVSPALAGLAEKISCGVVVDDRAAVPVPLVSRPGCRAKANVIELGVKLESCV